MRFFVSVGTIGAGPAITEHAGSRLAQTIARNLHTFRVMTGFDYQAFSISGMSIDSNTALTTKQLADAVRSSKKDIEIGRIRVIVANVEVIGDGGDDGFRLVIGIGDGDSFAWNPASGPMQAKITIPIVREDQKNAAILDVFQEIMIANCSSIQSVVRNYLSNNNIIDDFYRKKAEFIKNTGLNSTILYFCGFDKYISFSSVARTNLRSTLTRQEATYLGSIWQNFLEETMSDYFLSTDQAVELVRNGYFHDTYNFTRRSHQYLAKDELEEIIGDRQLVPKSGAYILCVRSRNPQSGDVGEAAARFGRSGTKIRRIKLCDNENYSSMRTLVEHGVVTPIKLFLKRP